MRRARGSWETVPYVSRGGADARGLGLHDMVESVVEERPHRTTARLASHVVDVARSILEACDTGSAVVIESTTERPDALPVAVLRSAEEGAQR
jgi:hypothetical protein